MMEYGDDGLANVPDPPKNTEAGKADDGTAKGADPRNKENNVPDREAGKGQATERGEKPPVGGPATPRKHAYDCSKKPKGGLAIVL